jgi:hypothetical protein
MRVTLLMAVALLGCLAQTSTHPVTWSDFAESFQSQLAVQPNSLCASDEQIIFSCPIKRTAKIVSLCASGDLGKEHGYLQYRFGLPGKVELEFPKDRKQTQQQFHYSHYFRYQVDLTEISFSVDGYGYSIVDTYNGEEKPAISEQGVRVTAPGKPKETTFTCAGKPKADYSKLQDVLPNEGQ